MLFSRWLHVNNTTMTLRELVKMNVWNSVTVRVSVYVTMSVSMSLSISLLISLSMSLSTTCI
jgi:hypothetical protein